MANNVEQRSFDMGASSEAQSNFESVASRLESLIDQRDADVRAAMAQYQADGVSEEYHAKEQNWKTAASEVKTIITTLRSSMQSNDDTASAALKAAAAAVQEIGG
ncbi:pore-forming ESAT-6 family protein [Actinomyces timonensis]|uniref:Pore-forming ESAT-6 family protein n=2 Tax=Actinomyces TaxID=1654 RepID=A0A6M8AXP3_9ACTO|nr:MULTISPECIES: pore-forming ESAT-6 family protein [Actinomyces]QKD78964.1 pore-forming ESAT-6 family protein [Actinomyces marmotae]